MIKALILLVLAASAKMLDLTSKADYLGTGRDVISKIGLTRTSFYPDRESYDLSFFDCCTATYHFPNGYRRYIGFGRIKVDSVPVVQTVKKYENGNGFFPTIAANEVKILFYDRSKLVEYYLDKMKERIPNISIDWTEDNTCHIKFPTDSNSIYEFDFMAHNFGFMLSKLEEASFEGKTSSYK